VRLRIAGVCGLLAFVTLSVGWIAGDLAQPDAYSSADDDTSDLGAMTANNAWIYNQIGDNLTGILVVLCGLGLWRALSPDVVGRIGAGALMLTGIGVFFDGVFRLDCRGIDAGCTNDSWHSSAHKMESRITVAATLLAPLILAFSFRRIARWRDAWLPTLAAVPVSIVIGVVFSGLGDGAAVRATTATWFVWLAYVAVRLIQATTPLHVQTE
jgi:Protein of unknown function (DUF998)